MSLRLDARDLRDNPELLERVEHALRGEPYYPTKAAAHPALPPVAALPVPPAAPRVAEELKHVPTIAAAAAPAHGAPGRVWGPTARVRAYVEGHPWQVLAWTTGFWLAVVIGALVAMPTLAPKGAVLELSTAGRAAAVLVRTGLPRWVLAPAVAAVGYLGFRRGGRLLLLAARLGCLVAGVAIAWALLRG